MAVTIAGKNYTQISSCDTSTSGGTWVTLTTQDPDNKKEGNNSLCGIVKNSGANTVTFTPTASVNLSGIKHVRFWVILTQGGLLNTYAGEGLNFWASDGTNTGYWRILGRDTYPGGWMNCVIDVSNACDSGTKPTAMGAITTMGIRINLTAAAKNAVNTWIDNLCVCDGLIAYGDDAGAYFDIDDIWAADDATTGGWGVMRKIGGQYFSTGSIEIGYATSATKFQAKSQVLVFENRRVNSALYTITAIDSGNASYTTEFILGNKSGTAGVEGCMLRVQDTSQACKFSINGATDTDVDNFKLYGTTFFDAGSITIPSNPTSKASVNRARSANVATIECTAHGLIVGNYITVSGLSETDYNGTWTVASVVDVNHFTYANIGDNEVETVDTGGLITSTNVEVLNCNFESSDEVLPSTGTVKYCNFISPNSRAIRYGANVTYCNFISCSIGLHFNAANTYTIYGLIFTNCTYDVENSTAGSLIVQNDNPTGSNAYTYTETGGGSTTIQNSVTLSFHVIDENSADIVGARVYVEIASSHTELMNELTITGGIASESYTGTIPANINVNIRQSSSFPKYFPISTSGQITTDGYSLTAVMIQDNIA